MRFDNEPQVSSSAVDNLMRSAKDAFSFRTIFFRLLYIFVFGVTIGIDFMIKGIDELGRQGAYWFEYFYLIFMQAPALGLYRALGSNWSVFTNIPTYIQSGAYGSIGFTFITMLLSIAVIFQPVSFIINIFDSRVGQAVSFIIRLFVTILIVIIASGVIYYMGGGADSVTTNIETLNGDEDNTIPPLINDTYDNITHQKQTTSIISLI